MATNMLLEAARDGKTDVLKDLIKESPSILADLRLTSLDESLLHVATKFGQLNFLSELMKIDPTIADEMNKDGFRALDIAVIIGNFPIVQEILSFDLGLCRLEGKDQRTALHYAAVKGRINVIDELLYSCPDCVENVTVHGETALHLAVKSYQFDACSCLVKWLERLRKERIVNMGDGDGNTVLHVAVSTKQYACINLLLSGTSNIRGIIQVNAKNAKGLSPLDILEIQDSYDIKIRQCLESSGAITRPNSVKKSQKFFKPNHHLEPLESPKNWFKYFKFQKQRDSPSDTRNALLVVAALIATVCFEAGINPPNGTLEKLQQSNTQQNNSTRIGPAGGSALAAASAVLGSHATSFLFLFANSLGLTASTCIIIYLTSGFPFQRELHIALYSMMFTYGFAISAVIKGIDGSKETMAYVLLMIAFVLPFAQRWLPRWGKRAWKYWRRREIRKSTPLPIDN